MEFIAGQTLVKKNKEELSADEVLQEKEVIAFYFSAHWCPPCRRFTPVLADFYAKITEEGLPFEIIFVSSDESADALFDYMNEAHGDWLAVPYDAPIVQKIKSKFNLEGIPTLVVVKKDGTLISEDATYVVEEKGPQIVREWLK